MFSLAGNGGGEGTSPNLECCIWRQACVSGICRSQLRAGHQPSSCVHTVWQCSCALLQGPAAGEGTSPVIMIAVLLCSLLRGARLQESRVQAMALLTEIAAGCDDDTRLQRIVPYLMVSSSVLGCWDVLPYLFFMPD